MCCNELLLSCYHATSPTPSLHPLLVKTTSCSCKINSRQCGRCCSCRCQVELVIFKSPCQLHFNTLCAQCVCVCVSVSVYVFMWVPVLIVAYQLRSARCLFVMRRHFFLPVPLLPVASAYCHINPAICKPEPLQLSLSVSVYVSTAHCQPVTCFIFTVI